MSWRRNMNLMDRMIEVGVKVDEGGWGEWPVPEWYTVEDVVT